MPTKIGAAEKIFRNCRSTAYPALKAVERFLHSKIHGLKTSSWFSLLAGVAIYCALFTAPLAADMQIYDSKYYVIHTDIERDEVKEAIIRMTKMAEEYHERTKSFAGIITTKFPFYLYRSSSDYYNNGGLPGTAGVFIVDESGERLMAIAGRKTTLDTWHTVQHEGFHQFAHAVIGGKIPTWLNEGLAEYFGESIFTGDGFVTGVVPPWRLARLKEEIDGEQIKSVRDIMLISPEQWRAEMNIRNYDQAWSMVHFLVHGDDGKYQSAFSSCIRGISQGRSFERAWLDSIGPLQGFEDRWKQYWISQPTSPTSQLYSQAAVATLTSFLGRATAEKQTFNDYQAFQNAAEANKLRVSAEDWLPPSLLANTLRTLSADQRPDLHLAENKQPSLTFSLADGTLLTGRFVLRGSNVDQVDVEIDELPKILKDTKALLANGGKKSDVRTILQTGLHRYPKSPAAVEVRKYLQSLK